jgi:DNA-binding MurR/RpiR family transcriptional regulator
MPKRSPGTRPHPAPAAALLEGNEWLADLLEHGRLTPKGATVGRYITGNPRYASFASASELAGKTGVNVATVVRFAQNLGFEGWREFQLHLRHRYLGSLLPSAVLRDQGRGVGRSAIEGALRRDHENLEAALTSIDFEQAERAAALIARAPRTLVVASGSYSAVGHVLAHLAQFMGYNVTLETRGGAHVVAALASFRQGDVVVAISFWRLVKHVMLTTEYCRREGITTIALTDSLFSPLAKAADHALIVPTESVSFFQSMTAALSLVYGLLSELHRLGGAQVAETIEHTERIYAELDVLLT